MRRCAKSQPQQSDSVSAKTRSFDCCCGKTNKEIAIALNISEKTVKNYMTILMQKLNARNRLEVVIAAQAFTEHELGDANRNSQSQRQIS
jgi:DNA-binding NarL/FixJ family response regulator